MGSIDFDAQAARLGLTRGQTYRFDVFHAERHTSESNFRMQTSIECFRPPEIQ
jgi:fibro-slime domain-containing protein